MQGIWLLSYLFLWVVVVCEGFALAILLRQLGLRMLSSPSGISRDGLAVGAEALPLVAVDAEGKPHAIGAANKRDALVLFGSISCGPCERLLPGLTNFSDEHPDLDVYLLTADGVEKNKQYVRDHGLRVPMLHSPDGATTYKVRVSPFAFLIDSTGHVRAKGLVNREDDLEALISSGGQESLGSSNRQLAGSG